MSRTKQRMANNLPFEKKERAVSELCEGTSIRAIERMTGVHRDTIMHLGVRVGEACAKIMDERMRDIPSYEIQVDEIWGFIGKKKRHIRYGEETQWVGDVWTFIAIDRDTKLIPSYFVGRRDMAHAQLFLNDLQGRLRRRVQLSSDGLNSYTDTVERAFGRDVDYGQIVKTYSVSHLGNFKEAARRYSPAEVVQTTKTVVIGFPDVRRISTSHVEKQNHTLRMHCRRLTRLTNAFSKKLENFKAAVAMNFCYYNFCKRNLGVLMTPAQAAGLEASQWTVAELIERCGE